MSLYSGFCTKKQQSIYDSLIYNILSVLAIRIIKFYKGQNVENKHFQQVLEIQSNYLKKLQKKKNSDPKYSCILDQLYRQIFPNNLKQQIKQNKDNSPNLKTTYQLFTKQLLNVKSTVQSNNTKIQDRILNKRKSLKKVIKEQNNTIFKLNKSTQYVGGERRQKFQKMPQLTNFRISQNDYSVKKIEWKDLKHQDYPLYKIAKDIKVRQDRVRQFRNNRLHNTLYIK